MGKGNNQEPFKVTDDILEKVLLLDCREEVNVRRLKKSLMKLPFINSVEDTQTDVIEEKVKKLELRFAIHLSYIMRSVVDTEDIYTGMIKTTAGDNTGKWLKTVYGKTTWEVLAKTLFFMYYHINKHRKKDRIVK